MVLESLSKAKICQPIDPDAKIQEREQEEKQIRFGNSASTINQ